MGIQQKAAFSHLLAVVVGVAAAISINHRSAEDGGISSSQRVEKRERQDKSVNADELLAALQSDFRAEDSKRNDEHSSKKVQDLFRELSKSLAPTDDPKATYLELAAAMGKAGMFADPNHLTEEERKALATLGVRYAQWFRLDPKAAIEAAKSDDSVTGLTSAWFSYSIAGELYKKQGLRAAMEWMPSMSQNFVSLQIIGGDIGRRGSAEDIRWLLESHSDFAANKYFPWCARQIGESWPVTDGDSLVSSLSGKACANAMLGFAKRMEGSSGADWIQSWIESGRLDAEAVKGLSSGDAAASLSDKEGLSIAERVAVIRQLGVGEGTDDKRLKAQLITGQINEFFRNGDDWLYAFRHGAVTADELLNAALKDCPDPGDAKNEFRNQIYRHLAEDDPEAALELLRGTTDGDREWQKIHAARWWFNGVDPDLFYQTVTSISYEGDPVKEGALREAWGNRAAANLERFGEDYLTWVRELPTGPHRTWALESLQNASKAKYPWINEEVNTLLGQQP